MPEDISNDDLERVREAMATGRKIDAIKMYREATGAGLAEAKQFVERMELNPRFSAPAARSMTNDDIDQIQAALCAGEKIKAIKLYRNSTGEGLKESKEFIDALEAELRRTDPTRFIAPPARGCNSAVFIVLALAAFFVLLAFVVM